MKNPCLVEFVGEDEKQGFKMTLQATCGLIIRSILYI